MITRKDLVDMDQGIRDLEDALEALPSFIFILKIHLAMAKREMGITEPLHPTVDAHLIEAAVS